MIINEKTTIYQHQHISYLVASIMKALDAKLLQKACSKMTEQDQAQPCQKRLIEVVIVQ
jgi:hypothetical protein